MSAPPPVPLDALLRHREWVRALARRLVADPNLADDVVQETWLEALRHPPRHDASARGWLATVARNAARKLIRGAARRERHEAAAPPADRDRPTPDLVAEADAGRQLIGFVLALDEPYRSAVLMRWYEGLEPPEIAARLGVPVETVRTRLKRATAQLRDRMDERHRGDRSAWALVLVGPAWRGRGAARWGEGLVMATTKKLAIAAAALLLIGSATWMAWPSRDGGSTPASAPPTSASESAAATTRRAKATSDTATAAAAATPGPADPLLRVDPATAHRVKVITSGGDPVAGATIELHLRRDPNTEFPPEVRARFGETPAPDGRFTTGADGVALLPKLPHPVTGTMIVRRPGFAVASAPSDATEIVLLPGFEIAGRVVDARGRAVAGATVCAGTKGTSGWTGPDPTVTTGRAGADGRFALRDLPAGTVALFAGWPGGTPTKALEVVLPSAREVNVTLPGGGAIQGRVTEAASGAPVEGAAVSVAQWGNNSPTGPAFASATTRADGTYRVDRFPADSWDEVKVTKPGWYEPAHGSRGIHQRVPIEGTVTVDLTLARGGRVTGRVLGPAGPVAGAAVAVIGANSGDQPAEARTKTADDGRFAFDGLPPGRAAFAVQAAGCVQEGWPGRRTDDFRAGNFPADATVEVRAGEEVTCDLHLVRGVVVSGRLLAADGSAVPGVRVGLQYGGDHDRDGPRGWDGAPSATSGADGAFELTGVAPDSKLSVYAWSGDVSASAQLSVEHEDVRDVLLRLAQPAAPRVVHVRVVWPDGAAPRGAVWYAGGWSGWVRNSGNLDNAYLWAPPHVVPADGRFDVPAGSGRDDPVVVRVVAPGFAPADSPPVEIGNDAREASVEIRPVPADAAHLAGTVVVNGGAEAVASAQVRLRRIDPSGPPVQDVWYAGVPRPVIGPVAASSDARGAFDATSLAPGRYDVQVIAPGFEWWTGKADVPGNPLRVELPRLGVLVGRVRFADGSAAAGVWVTVQRGDIYRADTITDADGRFRFDDAPGGGLTVWVSYNFDGTGANVRQLQLPGWKHAGEDLDVVAEPGLSIAGRIVDSRGAPMLCTAIVRATAEGERPRGESAGTRADGTFEIRGLGPGRFKVGVELYPLPGAPRLRVESVAGVEAGAAGLSLVARSGLSIEGDVAIPAEAAQSVLRVLARRPGVRGMDANREPGVSGTLDSNGHLQIDGMDAGRWRIVFQDDQGLDSPWQPGDAAFVEAGDSAVHLTLSTASTISGVVTFDGAPMQGCDVVAQAVGDEKDVCSVRAWSEGRFTFVGLDASKRWAVTAYRENMAPARAANVTVGTAGLRLELSAGLSIRGRLLRADGTRAANVHISFRRADDASAGWAKTGDDGAFEARGVEAGEYTAKAWVPAAKEGEPGAYVDVGRVRAGDADVELHLPR